MQLSCKYVKEAEHTFLSIFLGVSVPWVCQGSCFFACEVTAMRPEHNVTGIPDRMTPRVIERIARLEL